MLQIRNACKDKKKKIIKKKEINNLHLLKGFLHKLALI